MPWIEKGFIISKQYRGKEEFLNSKFSQKKGERRGEEANIEKLEKYKAKSHDENKFNYKSYKI